MAAIALRTRSEAFGKGFGHVFTGSGNNRDKRRRQKTVTWPLDEKICEVRSFLINDAPSMLGVAQPQIVKCHQGVPLSDKISSHPPIFHIMGAKLARMEHDNRSVDVPPGFGFTYTAEELPQSKSKTETARSITVPWHCPQKFLVGASWQWAGGEGSLEVASQQEREKRTLEAFYPRVASIPDSPLEPQEQSKEYDDALVPHISLVPVEEEEMEDMEQQSSSGDADLCMSELHRKMADAFLPRNGTLHKAPAKQREDSAISFTNTNIAAAAAAACMVVKAIGESDRVDKGLLVELLKNPSLLKSLTCSKIYMKEKSQEQDCGIATRPAAHQEPHKLLTDYVAYLDRFPVSVLAPWGDCDTKNNAHKVAPIVDLKIHMQHSTSLSSSSMKPLASRMVPTPYSCSDSEFHRSSEQNRVQHMARVHEQIPGVTVINPSNCSTMKETSSMHAYVPREYTRSHNGSTKTSQTRSTQAALTTSAPLNVHPTSTPGRGLAQRNSTQLELAKHTSAEHNSLPRKSDARDTSSKTGARLKRYCLYFNTLRGCRNGEHCTFVH